MKTARLITLGLLLATAGTDSSAGKLYKWIDAEGRVHYSDTPPPHNAKTSTELSGQLDPINQSEASREHDRLRSVFPAQHPAENAIDKKEQQRQQAAQQDRNEFCRKARIRLKKLKGRVVFIDHRGAPIRISEQGRARRAAELERRIERYCR